MARARHDSLTGAPALRVISASGAVRRVALLRETFTVGRSSENDLALDDPRVSRHHLELEHDGDAYRIRDLGSRNR